MLYRVTLVIVSFFLGVCNTPFSASSDQTSTVIADQIIIGNVITMNDAQPNAEAFAIKDGEVVLVGDREEVLALKGEYTETMIYETETIVPGFIDAHGHIGLYPRFVIGLPEVRSPPIGPITNISELLESVRDFIAENEVPEGETVYAFGYDDSLLAEKRHPTRDDLDKISTTHAIVLHHTSGHLSVGNSLALERAGYNNATPDPDGGTIWRDEETGALTGVVDGNANSKLTGQYQQEPDEVLSSMAKVSDFFASYGITTAQDGITSAGLLAVLRQADEQGLFTMDVISYPNYASYEQALAADHVAPHEYGSKVKVAGVKISADGSPQGKTAFMTEPYLNPPLGQGRDYRGKPKYTQGELDNAVETLFSKGLQLLMHCNGDACADMMIEAVSKATEKLGPADRRPVMIHAQTVRDDQIRSMKKLGIIPSYFVTHTFYWGDWHRDEVFGEERANRISPLATTENIGVTYTIHNDAPVVPPDMMFLMHAAVNRHTRSDKVLGPEERVTAQSALRAITISAAYQNFEENAKGSLEVGKQADYVILSENPLTVVSNKIKDIEILRTVNDGETIFVQP